MSENGAQQPEVDLDDPKLTRFDLVREGARQDGVEIVHYEPQALPGSKAEKRVVRFIAFCFLMAGLLTTLFVVFYIWWPIQNFPDTNGWRYEAGRTWMKGYTPVLGATLGLALVAVGFAILTWAKKLLPHEVSIQERHDGPSDPQSRKLAGASLQFLGEELGVARRPLLKFSLLGLAPLGLAAAAVPIGMLIKDPHKPDVLFHTGWDPVLNGGKPIRLVRDDYTPIRPEEVSIGGQMTVFPGLPDGSGTSNEHADSPTLLIRLREEDAAALRSNLKEVNQGSMYGNLVAYSKICTHAGCPASLYEQQTNLLLCPCHQSQFHITDNARPVFGPATRALPMLPIDVDADGYLIATSDYKVPVGPAFWERP